MRLYYVTFPDDETREQVTDAVVDERLAACMNAFPITTCYWWEDGKEDGDEVVALLKTADDRGEELVERLQELHPYDVPCIMEIPVSANEAYEDWIEAETR